jgi:hypothetical protein
LISRCSCENPYSFPSYFRKRIGDAFCMNVDRTHTNEYLIDRARSQLHFKPKKVAEMSFLIVVMQQEEGAKVEGVPRVFLKTRLKMPS